MEHRLRLFEATVTQVLLYSSGTWTLTAVLEKFLKTTQSKMLRWIVRVGRKITRVKTEDTKEEDESTNSSEIKDDSADTSDEDGKNDLESWVEWIRRSTSIAEGMLKNIKIEDWIAGRRRRKFRWAGHVARRSDERWSYKVLYWKPVDGRRVVGHPKKRRTDIIDSYFEEECDLEKGAWMALAQCRETWKSFENKFVD